MKKSEQKNFGGFTLIELAIVLTVIGLIVAGVLGGQDLIRQSEIDSQIKQITYYKGAIDRFKEKYGCIPGDYNEAVHTFGATAGNEGNCNKVLDTDGLGNNEYGYFWEHLSKSKLITENYEFVDDTCGAAPGGVQCPVAKYGSNTYIQAMYYSVAGSGHVYGEGNGLEIRNFAGANFAPWVIKEIDTKIDDGLPHYGNLIGYTMADPGLCVTDDKTYNVAVDDLKQCNLYYFFETPTSSW